MTKPKSQFWKNYEHPLWQKRRLEILTRDEFQCQLCCSSEEQLHIHHAYYISGRKPWEYPDWSLLTLCKDCHKSQKQDPEKDVEFESWEVSLMSICRGHSPMMVPVLWDISHAVEHGLAGGLSLFEVVHAIEAAMGMHEKPE